MNISPSQILFRCGVTDLLRDGRLTRTTYPEELTDLQYKETFTRASTKNVFGIDGRLVSVGVNGPALDYVDASTPTLLLEAARTNVVLWNRDLTNAAWTKTNVTAVKDQAGLDLVTNSASKITASAGNGTCLQAITLASSARFQSAYVKRITGTGTINMTLDNGSTWTAITVTAAWTRVTIPTQTLANPTVGFRIVTNGDAIAVDYVQNEAGVFPTSPIAVTTVAVARAVDALSFPYMYKPQGPIWIYANLIEAGAIYASTSFPSVVNIGNITTWRHLIAYNSTAGHYKIWNDNSGGGVTKAMTTSPTLGQRFELLGHVYADGSVQLRQSIAEAAESATTVSSAQAMPSSFGTYTLTVNDQSYVESVLRLRSLKVGLGTPTAISDVRSLP